MPTTNAKADPADDVENTIPVLAISDLQASLKMRIRDPDGNILWLGTEPLKDIPFGNEPADRQLPR